MNITVGIEGDGVNESFGSLASVGNDRMKNDIRFNNPNRQTLLITVTYSGNARYTLNAGGSVVRLSER